MEKTNFDIAVEDFLAFELEIELDGSMVAGWEGPSATP
jgi:hypothetical protein